MGRHQAEDLLAAAVTTVLGRLPRSLALGTGASLGRLVGSVDRRHLGIAVDNLHRAFPEWDEARLLRTARGVYAHFGRVLFEILWMRGKAREDILGFVEFEGKEHVEEAMAAGKGAIMATCHIGNWELHGLVHGYTFGPIGVVARPLDNPALDRRLVALRTMGGNSVIYKNRALSQILRLLRAGRGVAILIDQNVQESDGIFVDFFGRPAATTTVAAALAVKTGCALVPCHTEMREDLSYRVSYNPVVRWSPSSDRQKDITLLTQELTRAIEAWVRGVPEQWLWIHRRWKTQPALPNPVHKQAEA